MLEVEEEVGLGGRREVVGVEDDDDCNDDDDDDVDWAFGSRFASKEDGEEPSSSVVSLVFLAIELVALVDPAIDTDGADSPINAADVDVDGVVVAIVDDVGVRGAGLELAALPLLCLRPPSPPTTAPPIPTPSPRDDDDDDDDDVNDVVVVVID